LWVKIQFGAQKKFHPAISQYKMWTIVCEWNIPLDGVKKVMCQQVRIVFVNNFGKREKYRKNERERNFCSGVV
jgi:hypothetical protein